MSTPAVDDETASAVAEAARPRDTHMETQDYEQETDEERTSHGDWIDVVSKANRKKNKKRPQETEVGQSLATTSARGTTETRPRGSPKPPPLPKSDFKMVIRPMEGLDLRKYQTATLSDSILNATQLSWKQADLKIRIDHDQNIITVSTPHEFAARKLDGLTHLNIQGQSFKINHYGLFPQNSSKGVIHGVPSHYTPEEILSDLWLPGYEIATCRRLGQSSSVVITFLGPKVPFYVYYKGVETRSYLYKKTLPYCYRCYTQGHRTDVCPTPHVMACERCGLHDPQPNHLCNPKCDLCQGDHLTASKDCRQRFREPYLLRRKKWEREHPPTQQEPTRRSRSTTRGGGPAGRSGSRSAMAAGSRSSSRARAPTEKQVRQDRDAERCQVSWANVLSPTARPPNPRCSECDTLQQEIKTLRAEVQSLKALMAQQIKSANTDTPPTQASAPTKPTADAPSEPRTAKRPGKKRRLDQVPLSRRGGHQSTSPRKISKSVSSSSPIWCETTSKQSRPR